MDRGFYCPICGRKTWASTYQNHQCNDNTVRRINENMEREDQTRIDQPFWKKLADGFQMMDDSYGGESI